jgi:hypothetical protein
MVDQMNRRDAARLGQRAILAIAVLLLSSAVAHGATYYVRTDGNNGNDGLSNTTAGAWLTMNWAGAQVSAGDVVRVQAGTYSERVSPAVSGTSASPITFVADGAVTFCGMDISNKNYLRVIGFAIVTDAGTCTKSNRAVDVSGTNTGLEFWNNTFRDANYVGIGSGSYADRHHNFLVIGNTFSAIGGGGGNGSAVALRGNNNLFAYNEISAVDPDAFQVDGTSNRWLNNYIHNVLDTFDLHSDVFQSNSSSLGLSNNLFEGNFEEGNGTLANEHGALLQNQSVASCSTGTCGPVTENLFRRNVWHNTSGGVIGVDQAIVGTIANTRQVHDTVISPMRTQPTATYAASFSGVGINAYLYNNVEYQAWGSNVTSGVQAFLADGGAIITGADYNLAYTPDNIPTYATPWVNQAHPRSNLSPSFVDYANDNFTLGATSGARGMGGPLTTVNGSGTGTTFNVANGGGGFFRGPNANVSQYGGNLTAGDVITIGNTTRTIASVSGDAITVTASFTWTNGDAVYLGTTTTPDIGAYPYKTGGYNLTAAYSLSGGLVTITPSDASLVRFVVCYVNGIPTTVDNSSPYTCSVGAGSLDVRVYSLYASKTLFIAAAQGPSTPTNVKVSF